MTDRNQGAGPYTAGKCQVWTEAPGEYDGTAVFDVTGQPFCLIGDDLAVGGRPGAMARAQRIAEALDRDEKRKAALIKAREVVQTERDSVVECATMPPHDDLTTLDDLTREAVEAYDQVLAQIDEALR